MFPRHGPSAEQNGAVRHRSLRDRGTRDAELSRHGGVPHRAPLWAWSLDSATGQDANKEELGASMSTTPSLSSLSSTPAPRSTAALPLPPGPFGLPVIGRTLPLVQDTRAFLTRER